MTDQRLSAATKLPDSMPSNSSSGWLLGKNLLQNRVTTQDALFFPLKKRQDDGFDLAQEPSAGTHARFELGKMVDFRVGQEE